MKISSNFKIFEVRLRYQMGEGPKISSMGLFNDRKLNIWHDGQVSECCWNTLHLCDGSHACWCFFINVSQVYIYFLLETKDVFIKIQKNKRRMRSLSHNYKKSDQNMIELCYYTRSLYKRFRLRHNLKRFHPLKFLLGTSQWCPNLFGLHIEC